MNNAIKQINPTQADQIKQKVKQLRHGAIEMVAIQAQAMYSHWSHRSEVDHQSFRRLVRALLKLSRMVTIEDDTYGEGFVDVMRKASDGSGVVHNDGQKIYIEGYYDLKTLRKEFLW